MTAEQMKKALISYRKEKGMSQMELATKSNLTQSTISTMEKSDFYPSMYSFLRVCEGLEITPSQFFEKDGDKDAVLTDREREVLQLWNGYTNQNKDLVLAILNCLKDSQEQHI